MNVKKVLELQDVFGRTRDGRIIGKKIIPLIKNTLANPEFGIKNLTECKNCRIVLGSEYFSDGCINCGSKEIRSLEFGEDKRILKKK